MGFAQQKGNEGRGKKEEGTRTGRGLKKHGKLLMVNLPYFMKESGGQDGTVPEVWGPQPPLKPLPHLISLQTTTRSMLTKAWKIIKTEFAVRVLF